MAWLLRLAFRSGLHHGRRHDLADWLEGQAARHSEPPSRAERIAAEVERAGPAAFPGGGVDWQAILADWEISLGLPDETPT